MILDLLSACSLSCKSTQHNNHVYLAAQLQVYNGVVVDIDYFNVKKIFLTHTDLCQELWYRVILLCGAYKNRY